MERLTPMLKARDVAETIAFYTKTLGFVVENRRQDEDGKTYARRILNVKYGEGNWDTTEPRTEFSRIKKWADEKFQNPAPTAEESAAKAAAKAQSKAANAYSEAILYKAPVILKTLLNVLGMSICR